VVLDNEEKGDDEGKRKKIEKSLFYTSPAITSLD
jgi:hypothetical protein